MYFTSSNSLNCLIISLFDLLSVSKLIGISIEPKNSLVTTSLELSLLSFIIIPVISDPSFKSNFTVSAFRISGKIKFIKGIKTITKVLMKFKLIIIFYFLNIYLSS